MLAKQVNFTSKLSNLLCVLCIGRHRDVTMLV